jgi:ParB family chromosome partitioning protein
MSGRQRVPQDAWKRIIAASPEEGVQPLRNAKEIDINLVHTDPRQPRKHFDEEAMNELIASVQQRGILQPITVQRRPEGGYFVVTGERRLRAARAANLKTVPALVVDLQETEMRLDRVIENRQRKDLTDLEFARAILEIRHDLGASAPSMSSNELDEYVGQHLGLAGRTIRSFAALLNLDPAIEAMLGDRLTEPRARGLSRVGNDRELQMDLARAILERDLSGKQTVAAAQLLKRNLGMTVDEAVDRVNRREPPARAEAVPLEAERPVPAPGVETALEEALDPNDPQRRYWLLTTYLSRAAAILDEPGADEEVPLNRQQVGDLGRLLEPLQRLQQVLAPALEYIERKRAEGDTGYEGEPLPRKYTVMLPYAAPPEPEPAPRALHSVKGTGADHPLADRPAPGKAGAPRLKPVPKRQAVSDDNV